MFFVISPTRGDRLQAALGVATRVCWGNDENCFCRSDAAATTMAALSALQIYRQGHNMRQTFQRGPFILSHLFPSY